MLGVSPGRSQELCAGAAQPCPRWNTAVANLRWCEGALKKKKRKLNPQTLPKFVTGGVRSTTALDFLQPRRDVFAAEPLQALLPSCSWRAGMGIEGKPGEGAGSRLDLKARATTAGLVCVHGLGLTVAPVPLWAASPLEAGAGEPRLLPPGSLFRRREVPPVPALTNPNPEPAVPPGLKGHGN